jgi:hypothetical protein
MAQPPAAPGPVSSETFAADERSAEDWLAHLEAAAAQTATLTARVRMTSRVDLLDEETVRFGDLRYAAAADPRPARFAVDFDVLRMDEQAEPIDQRYVFDGRWLLDLDAVDRVASRRQLVPAGQTADLELGEGPFPLPLNLKKDRVLERFEVRLLPAGDDDPRPQSADDARVVHLQLLPRSETDLDAVQVDLWFDAGHGLPLRALTLQDDGDATTVDLFELLPNAEVVDAAFDTAFPPGDDWERQTVPLD